jgi:hypothetical protein
MSPTGRRHPTRMNCLLVVTRVAGERMTLGEMAAARNR